ncbi:MAG: hypothetical protein H6572_02385 [Lewinellaceae bacterium]|nr:hypothetical protein [Lewinellaceae bacterium]
MEINLAKMFGLDESSINRSEKILLHSIKENAQTNFDYLKFKKAVLDLQALGQSEEMAIKSAYTTAKSLGLDKSVLELSLKHYLMVLKKEKEKFADAFNKQYAHQVGEKERSILEIDKEVKNREKQILNLNKEIEMLNKKSDDLKVQIEQNSAKINETKSEFIQAYSELEVKIEEDLSKILTSL